ncbi:hypothetical protein CVT24_002258 [Panaeolus cyanescens]|uniref:Mediator of RNA polymerase II transcription subunit 9 n=1 Tax=Panaeolus cyanescens TaxID=181874 RepID=A0A409WXI6_9AGAR|nr:hypothetical protein CVT24_002258 [Panaeolus cyanescens]
MSSTSTTLPIALYESLLAKLIAIIELTQQPGGVSNAQGRQRLLQATNEFKNAITQAKDYAVNLPGGELVIEEQDQVIAMLETLKERKRAQLAEFAARKVFVPQYSQDLKMEIDSMASTPFHSND